MKRVLHLSAILLLISVTSRCMAEISVETLSKARAKELGIELRAQANGPKEAWIELEFRPEGQLKDFSHVNLEIRDGDQFLLGWTPLQAKRSDNGKLKVNLMANRTFLQKVTLRIVTGLPEDAGHDLRIMDFIDLQNLR
jgi:hypothetical protein